MSWVENIEYKWYEKTAINVIKCGTVPKSLAFILDGNRRFSKNTKIDRAEGHAKGFQKFKKNLRWCMDLGIAEVTAYMFSIHNFKRDKEEVDSLMNLMREEFTVLLEDEDALQKNGLRICIIGNIYLLPPDVQRILAQTVLLTENNNQMTLHLALAYTFSEEIVTAIQDICEDGHQLDESDITVDLIGQCLRSKSVTNPDILIRTSGESRLSDFLMWQLSSTVLYFPKTLWPAITLWHILYGIFCYQRALFSLSKYKDALECASLKSQAMMSDRTKQFLQSVDTKRRDYLVNLVKAKHKTN